MALDEEESRKPTPDGKVRIWEEVTVRLGSDPQYNFVRFTVGQEALVNNSSAARARGERRLHASLESIVESRVDEYKELIEGDK